MDCTPDMIPVIDLLDNPRGLVIASGFSGHGFGMGPVVGKLVSELIVDAIPSIDLSALRLSRFKKGRKTKASPVV